MSWNATVRPSTPALDEDGRTYLAAGVYYHGVKS